MSNNSGDATNTVYQIAVRFGDEVLQGGFTSVPNLVLNQYAELGISPAEMMFTIHVWQYWWTEKDPYPSLRAIAGKMNVSMRQVHNYAASLKKKGYLIVTQRYSPGQGQVTSEYDFAPLLQAVVKLIQASTPLKEISGGGVKEISGAPLNPTSHEEDAEKEYPVESIHINISKDRDSVYGPSKRKGGVGGNHGLPDPV